MKKAELQFNGVGGVDLLTERDRGNEVLILTGNKKNSLPYWKKLKQLAEEAIDLMENEE